ncbi:MAG: hypothetical protein FD169_1544 [Bacillota bacterium]|nr:MAG: hypothetical protein FD169_1544 [Bacillota bacterium]
MNCEWITEHICDMLGGLLTPEEHDAVQAHLNVCPECSFFVSELRQDMLLLQGLGDVPVPVDLKLRIAEALAKPKPQKNPWRFFLPRFAPVAAAVLISILSINTIPGYMASREQLTKETQIDGAPRLQMAAPDQRGADPEVEGTGNCTVTDTINAGAKLGAATEELMTMSLAADKTEPSLWVVSSAAGSTVLLLWGAVVYRWYKKV